MLETVMRSVKNWFLVPNGIHAGDFTVQDGGIELPFLQNGQYFRIIGSVFNDGVYQYPADNLTNETFTGAVWALAVPRSFLALVDEISEWQEKNGKAVSSPYQSENYFGQYSYTKGSDPATGGAVTWETAFRDRLNRWRKL